MPSFWPWSKDDSSAASFEKVLSQLSTKINRANATNDSLRQQQRRYKVLWTLYSTFAYILVAAILTLVTGYQRWSAVEYTAIVGSPVLIFGIRTGLDALFSWRIAASQKQLESLYAEREKAIRKLKDSTKYDRTQQLLDKYGGTPARKSQPPPELSKKRKSDVGPGRQGAPQGPRTGFAPPPTANIQRPPTAPQPDAFPRTMTGLAPDAAALMQSPNGPGEEFAPNAFPMPSRQPPAMRHSASQQYSEGPKWYDRIMDVVLGEDETQAKNRIALICQNCRLVNGQAPPGARTLEDVGRWRCSSCQAWNGVESEEKKMLRHIANESEEHSPRPGGSGVEHDHDHDHQTEHDDNGDFEHIDEEVGGEDEAEPLEEVTEHTPPAASTRSKARQRKKA
ncbi:hypothetical protein BAUCODRAFT_77284 [Baudoinia panamericana UAMH 10762]|uniref:Endoplasmic reticulum junction formation protein lunapark n=1 Tax=Baudoinia panamericana (strain UAMH 10762) TaxID=717646 RepID=M2MNQ2_BAUPA|nr:uncharacterized protein BAUCODRAFT_77284 [Baudoinia panamericana UAMH 10762]EMC93073.1 hypothetical protein BAUCODRAFT_77284 [Baudoinia panamericana UAMH 10762]